eukprot:scaffold142834_cov109-Phaeocystis_antarctica.AAC.2
MRHLVLPAGAGPRHLDFHPNGRWVYVLCELDGKVTESPRPAIATVTACVDPLPSGVLPNADRVLLVGRPVGHANILPIREHAARPRQTV